MNRGTTLGHISDVVAIEDRVLRNYWVTQTYADLSRALAELLDPDTANWCTFGTWASWTVGGNMRGDALPAWLREHVLLPDGLMGAVTATNSQHGWPALRHAVVDLEPEHVVEVLRELLGEMALNLSDGNTEVFAEITPPAAVFVSAYADPAGDPASARTRVLAACDGAIEFEGVNRLRAGYSLWCDAMATADATARSQLILAGSLQLGVHEQNHLQPAIASAMDLGINQVAARLTERIAKEAAALAAAQHDVDEALRPATQGIAGAWGDLITATLGTITSPEGTLRLDHDIPPIPGQAFEPTELRPVMVDELGALLTRFDRSRGPAGSGARDWANFEDRMNFIANLFVSRHHQTELFAAPFDAATLAAMMNDQIPSVPTPAGAT